MAFVRISLATAIGCAIAGYWVPQLVLGVLVMPLAAWWYWAAIQWVDTHGGWSRSS
ncbi:unnamed protein product [Gemmataceae bacterium]|nr:unnamed protein product [Gemmataceae bacterium]VTU01143.1 unnamed protein product [Gemmataceae bacterium]